MGALRSIMRKKLASRWAAVTKSTETLIDEYSKVGLANGITWDEPLITDADAEVAPTTAAAGRENVLEPNFNRS
uniref:Uncharacterized protein n=1 Tax=Romanomermis culicivorax TaxID=13658 RepID=A0A915HR50_ROMCU